MDVNKYQLAMRPKRYLTREFVVYKDPSLATQEASGEMQETRSEFGGGGAVKIIKRILSADGLRRLAKKEGISEKDVEKFLSGEYGILKRGQARGLVKRDKDGNIVVEDKYSEKYDPIRKQMLKDDPGMFDDLFDRMFGEYELEKFKKSGRKLNAEGGIQREGFNTGGFADKLQNALFEINKRNELGILSRAEDIAKASGINKSDINKYIRNGRLPKLITKEEAVKKYIDNALLTNKPLSEFKNQAILDYLNNTLPEGSKGRLGINDIKKYVQSNYPELYTKLYAKKTGAMDFINRNDKIKNLGVNDYLKDPELVKNQTYIENASLGAKRDEVRILNAKLKLGPKDFAISQAQDRLVDDLNKAIRENPNIVLDNPKLMELASARINSKTGELLIGARDDNKIRADIDKGFFSKEHLNPKGGEKINVEFPTNKILVPRTTNESFIRSLQSYVKNNPELDLNKDVLEFINHHGFNVRTEAGQTLGPKMGSTIENGKLGSFAKQLQSYNVDTSQFDLSIPEITKTELSQIKEPIKARKQELDKVLQIEGDVKNNSNTLTNVIRSLGDDDVCSRPLKANGGRVGFSVGSDTCYQQGMKNLMKAQNDPKLAKGVIAKAKNVGGKALRFLELPIELAIEGLLVGDAMLRGQSFRRAVMGNTLVMRTALPGGWSSSLDEETLKEISANNPAAQTYFASKTRSDKYKELKEKLANAEARAQSDVTFTDENYLEVDLAKKALKDFTQNNFQYFDRDKEILNPEGYYAQQANEAANKFFFDEARESFYGKQREKLKANEDMFVAGLDTYTVPTDIERAQKKLDPLEDVQALGFAPTPMEFEQSVSKDQRAAMKATFKKARPNLTERQLDNLVDIAMAFQYDIVTTPYQDFDPSTIQADTFATGGRVGFSGGGLTRRAFLKLAAGVAAAIGAVKTGLVKLTTPAAKRVLKDAPTGTPDWFAPLVDKIMKEGVDAGETMKTTTTREVVKKLEVKSPNSDGALTDTYFLYENPDTGEIRIEIDAPGLGANDGEFSLYFRPDRVEGINDDGTPLLSEGEFFVSEERAVGRMNGPDDFDMELETIDTDLSGSASNWHQVEEFATGKTDKKAEAEQLKKKDYIERNPADDIENRYGPFDDTPPDDD